MAPELGSPPPSGLKRGPRPRQAEQPAHPAGRGSLLLGPPAPTRRCAGEGEAQGAGRGVHLRRCPSESGGTGRLAMTRETPPPAALTGNQLPGAKLCSPPPEPEVAPRPEAGSKGEPGSRRPVSLGLGGAPQLHDPNPFWSLGLPQFPVFPTVRSFGHGLGVFPVRGRPLSF